MSKFFWKYYFIFFHKKSYKHIGAPFTSPHNFGLLNILISLIKNILKYNNDEK